MHQTEAARLTRCADCGAEIVSGTDRTYACDDESELCFECAVRRGGAYDDLHDVWTRAPSVTDLLEHDREVEPAVAR